MAALKESNFRNEVMSQQQREACVVIARDNTKARVRIQNYSKRASTDGVAPPPNCNWSQMESRGT
jgi:hypothetical protein